MHLVNQRLFVTGAAGQSGRAVVEELLLLGASQLVAGTRAPEKLDELRISGVEGVEVVPLDFDRPETLRPAFEGVQRLLLISSNAFFETTRRGTQHRAAIDAAVASHVEHVVHTSVVNPHPTSFLELLEARGDSLRAQTS